MTSAWHTLYIALYCFCRLSDLQIVHTTEVAKLQHSLQEESEKRAAAQRSLEELRGEVAIGIDDTSLSTFPGSSGMEGESEKQPQNFSKCIGCTLYGRVHVHVATMYMYMYM